MSCNQHDAKESTNGQTNKAIDSSGTTKAIDSTQYSAHKEMPDSVHPKMLAFDNWDSFWKSFTSAAKKKDTTTIVELTNFPFIQNSFPFGQADFLETFISQPFDLRIIDSPVVSDVIVLHIQKPEDLTKFDSVRYTNKNGRDFYFAKVNGYYRLVEIITPG